MTVAVDLFGEPIAIVPPLPPAVRIRVVPCRLGDAARVVGELHRHHPPPMGGLFAVAVADENGKIRGVAVVGRPVARRLDTGGTAEVTRVATDGTRNACSMLYGACVRGAEALGYDNIVTYTLPAEGGASLRASGWTEDGEAGGGEWSCKSRPRRAASNPVLKTRWSRKLSPAGAKP